LEKIEILSKKIKSDLDIKPCPKNSGQAAFYFVSNQFSDNLTQLAAFEKK
jgi:hypothetical protein